MVAALVRYHNCKSEPQLEHASYAALDGARRRQVRLLTSLLRIAEKLESEHAQRIAGVDVQIAGRQGDFPDSRGGGHAAGSRGPGAQSRSVREGISSARRIPARAAKAKGSVAHDSLSGSPRHRRRSHRSEIPARSGTAADGEGRAKDAVRGARPARAGREAGCVDHAAPTSARCKRRKFSPRRWDFRRKKFA